MHSVSRLSFLVFAAVLAFTASSCAPTPTPTPTPTPIPAPPDLTRKTTIHGVVTDAALRTPLKGVQVTLLSNDGLPAVTTDEHGYFQFSNVLQVDNVLVQFHADGYATRTLSVGFNPYVLDANNIDAFDASIELEQLVLIPVSGIIYDTTTPAKGAQVLLALPDGTVGYQTKTGADGRFSFPGVRQADWTLQVLPFDRDGDGSADTQFFTRDYDMRVATASSLSHLVIVLSDVIHAVVASSFISLSNPYPVFPGSLLTGVVGVLPAPSASLFLNFGSEVDPTLTSFELVQVEPGPRYSAPIGLTVAWDRATIANLTAAMPLAASTDASIGYELRLRALRFRDGTVAITPAPNSYGAIRFTVQALPTALVAATPSIYLDNQFTRTQAATSAVVDSSTVWLLDSNRDFVFDTISGSNFSASTGLQLGWTHVPGAVRYRVMARNTTSAGGGLTATLDWRELSAIGAPDPTLNTRVLANVNPWTGGSSGTPLGYGGAPWGFSNHVQFAVLSEDALGFRSAIDGSKLLDTRDTFGGLLTGAEVDPALGGIFGINSERGSSFQKTVRVSFSEAMNASTTPTLAPTNSNLTIKKVLNTTWGTNAFNPSNGPLNASSHFFANLQLGVRGACTELMVDRFNGDVTLPVRDASFFTASGGGRTLFLSSNGAFFGESIGISAIDAATNRLTLTTGLVPSIPAGSLVCSLQAPSTFANFVSTNTTTMVVSEAALFYVGETIMVYEPQVLGAGQIADTRTVVGVDTVTNTVLLNAALSAGHTTNSFVLPMNILGGEVALRSTVAVNLAKDAVGATSGDLFLTGPANVVVGDLLQVDADGDLKTTTDQVLVPVKQVKFAPTTLPVTYSVIVDLPALTLLHGKTTLRFMGDSFQVNGTKDTSGNTSLDTHRDQFAVDGLIF